MPTSDLHAVEGRRRRRRGGGKEGVQSDLDIIVHQPAHQQTMPACLRRTQAWREHGARGCRRLQGAAAAPPESTMRLARLPGVAHDPANPARDAPSRARHRKQCCPPRIGRANRPSAAGNDWSGARANRIWIAHTVRLPVCGQRAAHGSRPLTPRNHPLQLRSYVRLVQHRTSPSPARSLPRQPVAARRACSAVRKCAGTLPCTPAPTGRVKFPAPTKRAPTPASRTYGRGKEGGAPDTSGPPSNRRGSMMRDRSVTEGRSR
eukprot:scaffold29968_cov112-Isochrysis_galbana.AAC.5